MIILELNFEKEWRGGERQTIYNMQGFGNAGIETRLVCRKGSAIEVQAQKNGFTTYSFNSILGVAFFLATKGKDYNFLHAQTSHILTYCVFTKFFHKRKIIFTRRVNFIQKGILTKIKYRFTDRIIAISEAIKNTLTTFTKRTDIEVISDIVFKDVINISNAQPAIDLLNINGKHIIATTTSLTEEKDPFIMINAIKKLSEKRNDIVFLHFGSGHLKDAMIEKIKENKLEQTYLLMGFVENVTNYFPFFKVFVMSSKEEGLGSSVLDAFINKIPVVSTNAGGLKDLLKDKRGISCEIGDSTALSAGIDILLEDIKKRNEYISNAFNYVSQFHSMKYITDKYITVTKTLQQPNNKIMQASVVISYYKNIPNLELILLALNNQTAKGIFEVILSEDDNAIETQNFISNNKHTFSFQFIHLTQADEGFRKCRALNNAVKAATTDFLIFIDGDCIPHKQFVNEYIQNKKANRALYGRRVMLSKKISKVLLENKNISKLNFLNLLGTGSKRIEEALYLKAIPQNFKHKSSGRLLGCNMALNKQDLIAINGFDEDYIGPGGGEDSDIEWRLKAAGNIFFYSMKFTAIVYHIHHIDRFTKDMELKTNEILKSKINKGNFICKNGLKKLQ